MLRTKPFEIFFETGEEKTGNPNYVSHTILGEPVRLTEGEYYARLPTETLSGTESEIDIDNALERGRRLKEQFEQIKITTVIIEFRTENTTETTHVFVPDMPFETLNSLDTQHTHVREKYVCNPAPGEQYIDFKVRSTIGTGFIFEMIHPLVGNMYISLNRIAGWIGSGWCDFWNNKPIRDIKSVRFQYIVKKRVPIERLKSRIANKMLNQYSSSRLDTCNENVLSEAIDVFFKPNKRSQGGQVD